MAALRELMEETGIEAELAGSLGNVEIAAAGRGGAALRYRLTVFYGRYVAGVARPGSDAAAAEWVALPGLSERAMTEGTAALIAQAARAAARGAQRLDFAPKKGYFRTMRGPAQRLLRLGLGACVLAIATMVLAPIAEAQFFWSLGSTSSRASPNGARPSPRPPPGDDLPPIVPRAESSAPPPPDDRPYDTKLLRLAEILGAVHYLRELCGAQEGQLWRDQMKDILKNEGTTAVRRAKLVNSFNDGYRGYRRTYRSCTSSATLAITRFSTEGAQIAVALAQPSHVRKPRTGERCTRRRKTRNKAKSTEAGATPTDQTKPDQKGENRATKKGTPRPMRGSPAKTRKASRHPRGRDASAFAAGRSRHCCRPNSRNG